MEEFSLLGVRFFRGSRAETLAAAQALIAEEGASAAPPPSGPGHAPDPPEGNPLYLVTPNAEITYRASRDSAFRALLDGAALRVPDGVGVTLGARLFGVRLARFPGIELAEELLRTAPPTGYRLFLLGGRPGVAERAKDALLRRFPHITVVGTRDGYFAESEDTAVTEEIRAAGADLLFVCLGSPRQEKWMAAHPLPLLALGLGGSFDVWAGDVRRAPRFFRRAGLEWLWRIAHEPKRLGRAAALPCFLLAVLRARIVFFTQSATKKKRAKPGTEQM